MTSTRFATVRDLYQAFPVAQDDVGAEPSDEPTLEFLRELVAKENWDAAVSYCAYLLPRREAVWWGCQSLRMMQPHRAPQDNAAIEVAESWVREPEEPRRREALNLGSQGDTRSPATWMAIAAGWSGGSIVEPQFGIVPPPPHQTARAIRAGLLMAMSHLSTDAISSLMPQCIDAGIRLAVGSQD